MVDVLRRFARVQANDGCNFGSREHTAKTNDMYRDAVQEVLLGCICIGRRYDLATGISPLSSVHAVPSRQVSV